MCHFLGQPLGCAYTNFSYGQISISCTIPSGSPCKQIISIELDKNVI